MSEWMNEDREEVEEDFLHVEELLQLAADDMPVVRSGLKVEIVTEAQRMQRDVRRQQMVWGGLVFAMAFLGSLIFWPASPGSALASNQPEAVEQAPTKPGTSADAVDWELVESKTQLRRRNLEILRNAF